MNLNDILVRAIQENYNNPGSSNDFITPINVAHWVDAAIIHYWGIFQDNEYSYYNVNEQVLNITPYFNVFPIPNGDPAQSDQITFSAVPSAGNWTIKYTQNSVNYSSTSLAYNPTAAQVQAAINSNALGPQCTVTANWNVANSLGTQMLGFTILWDTSTLPVANGGNGPVSYSAFTNTTGVTITATPGTANIYAPAHVFITQAAIRQGTPPNYTYFGIPSIQPRKQFGGWNGLQAAILRETQSGSGSSIGWSLADGFPDGNGYPTLNIRIDPWPTLAQTMVYNGLRMPFKVPYLSTGQPIMTYIPDIPEHFHYALIKRVEMAAYNRAKADTSQLEREIKDLDDTQYAVESRSVQRQGPDMIENVWR